MRAPSISETDLFQVLISHLPKVEKQSLGGEYPLLYDDKKINRYVKMFRSPTDVSYLKKMSTVDIARVALVACQKNLFSFDELVSLHILLAAWKEFILELSSWMVLHSFDKFGRFEYYNLCADGEYMPTHKSNQIWKLKFDTPGIIDAPEFLRDENYKSLSDKVGIAYGQKELQPILKKYFSLNDEEWALFAKLMKNEPQEEQSFHLINFPLLGCASPFLQHLPRVCKSFNAIKLFYASEGRMSNYELYYNEAMPIPSFSAVRNFLRTKASIRNRHEIILIPLFGSISADEVYNLRKNGKWPLGLCYFASDKNESINRHIKTIDNTPGNAFGFFIHDLYHATRQIDLAENITEATFRIVDLLNELKRTNPKLKHLIESEVIVKVSEGTLIQSYKNVNSSFFEAIPNEKFGHIFHCKWVHWTQEIINYIVEDMVKERKLWKKKFSLDLNDLLEPEKSYYKYYSRTLRRHSTSRS